MDLQMISHHTRTLQTSVIFLFIALEVGRRPRSALPIGAEPAADPTRLVPVNINRDLLHLVLAVSFAKEPEEIMSR